MSNVDTGELRSDLALIASWIPDSSRVLDLGCADGELLHYLQNKHQVTGYGVDVEVSNIIACTQKGVSALQGNLEDGLESFEDASFDLVVLSQTIQAVQHTEFILKEVVRVGKQAIVSFPNFGYWQNRWQIVFKGHMPVSDTMPYQWYNTPNLHWCMLEDFEQLCETCGIEVLETYVMDKGRQVTFMPNLFGSLAFYRVRNK